MFFDTHHKTSDFICDGLLLWWRRRSQHLCDLRQLVIHLDNGLECNGRCSQFLLRMSEFTDLTGLDVLLGRLGKSWNGYLLSTVSAVLHRSGNFLWKGARTIVRLLDGVYEKGVKVCGSEKTGRIQK